MEPIYLAFFCVIARTILLFLSKPRNVMALVIKKVINFIAGMYQFVPIAIAKP